MAQNNNALKMMVNICVRDQGALKKFYNSNPYCPISITDIEKFCPHQGEKIKVQENNEPCTPLIEEHFRCNLDMKDKSAPPAASE